MSVANHQDKNTMIDSKYFIDYSRDVGRGTCSVVRECINRKTSERFAVKTINKYRCQQIEQMRNEIELLKELDHPHVLSLVDVYEDSNYLHLVTEYCKGGEIYDHMVKGKQTKVTQEREAVSIVKQLLDAVSYLHGKDIVHRDLKLENILFKTKKRDTIKLIDFDLAVKHKEGEDEPLTQECGSLFYVSPEVMGKTGYGKSCDIWAIGVVTYILLTARVPFYGESRDVTLMKIRSQDIVFPSNSKVSLAAQDFIQRALQKDPSTRATLKELGEHKWIQGFILDKHESSTEKEAGSQKQSLFRMLVTKVFSSTKGLRHLDGTNHARRTESLFA